jgi:hypothetical protein
MFGPGRRRPDGYGLGRGLLDRAADIIAARNALRVTVSDVTIHITIHAPPPVPKRDRMSGGPESVRYGWEAGRTNLTS